MPTGIVKDTRLVRSGLVYLYEGTAQSGGGGSGLGTPTHDWTLVASTNASDDAGSNNLTWNGVSGYWNPVSPLVQPFEQESDAWAIVSYGSWTNNTKLFRGWDPAGFSFGVNVTHRFFESGLDVELRGDSPLNSEFKQSAINVLDPEIDIFVAVRFDPANVGTEISFFFDGTIEDFEAGGTSTIPVGTEDEVGECFATNGGRVLVYKGANTPDDTEMASIRTALEGGA